MINPKKHILFVNGHLNVGGVERSLIDLLKHLDYNKYNVDLLLLEGLGDYISEVPSKVNIINNDNRTTYGPFFTVLYRSIKTNDWFAVIYRIILLLIRFLGKNSFKLLVKLFHINKKYDIAIAYRIGFVADLVIYGINAKKKYCWWHHGAVDSTMNLDNLKSFDRIIAVSAGIETVLIKQCPFIYQKVSVIPNMIDANVVISKSNLEPNPYGYFDGLKFVTIGRISIEKHFENVVFAAARLKTDRLFNFKWYIIGDGDLYAQVEELITKYGVSDAVVLCGRKSNPYPYIKHADIMVHTSHVESQGLVILEAMVLDVPCVVTRSIGPSEFIINGKNGIMVEPNVDSLVNGIIHLASNSKLQDKIVKNAKVTVFTNYSPEKIIYNFEKLIK